MQYDIRWMTNYETDLIRTLSKNIYCRKKQDYPANLNPNESQVLDLFLVPPNITVVESRKVVGVFDENGTLILAAGTRLIYSMPAWTLSWMISSISDIRYATISRIVMKFIIHYYEKEGMNEFYVVNPEHKELVYCRIMAFIKDRYWTFVEETIPSGSKSEYSLYHSMLGYAIYPYRVQIRRCILKRKDNE